MAATIDQLTGIKMGERIPRRGNAFSRGIGWALLRVLGWRIEGEFPDLPKLVVLGAPHTSNLDGVIAVAAMTALGLRAHLLGKHTLFWGPLGPALRWLDVVPVDRAGAHGVVERSVQAFSADEKFVLVLAPEGTRKAATVWKRGFWVIASSANVPLLPAALDYDRRRVVIGPVVPTSGDYDADLARVMDFYAQNARPRYPERASAPMRAALGLSQPPKADA